MAMDERTKDNQDAEARLKHLLARPRSDTIDLTVDDLRLVTKIAKVHDEGTSSSLLSPLSLAVLARAMTPTPTSITRDSVQALLNDNDNDADAADDSDTHTVVAARFRLVSGVLQVCPAFAIELLASDSGKSSTGGVSAQLEQAVRRADSITQVDDRDDLLVALAEMLALASGHEALRTMVRTTSGVVPWLQDRLLGDPGTDVPSDHALLTALAGVAVVKLRLGKESPEFGGSGAATGTGSDAGSTVLQERWSEAQLTALFVRLFIDEVPRMPPKVDAAQSSTTTAAAVDSSAGPDRSTQVVSLALEGLAMLTLVQKHVIKSLVATEPFLKPLLRLLTEHSGAGLDYVVGTVLHNLTTFPVPENAGSEKARLAKLAAARAGGRPVAEPESIASVTGRVSLIAELQPVPTLRQLCKSPALPTRRIAAKIIVSLVTPVPLRGKLLQEGIARLALSLLRHIPTPFEPTQDVDAVQALAKVLITTDPRLVLSPELMMEGAKVLTLPLAVTDDVFGSAAVPLLVKFECLMALTNVASLDAELVASLAVLGSSSASRKLLSVVQELLISNNMMVSRAATQLVCNLAASQAGWDYYAVPKSTKADSPPSLSNAARLVVALASSDDMETRIAAVGALTSLALEPKFGYALALYRQPPPQQPLGGNDSAPGTSPNASSSALKILLELVQDRDSPGARHRAYDVLTSIAKRTQVAISSGVPHAQKEQLKAAQATVVQVLRKRVTGSRAEVEPVGELGVAAKDALEEWVKLDLA